jgi:hypothetical protein
MMRVVDCGILRRVCVPFLFTPDRRADWQCWLGLGEMFWTSSAKTVKIILLSKILSLQEGIEDSYCGNCWVLLYKS